MNFLAPNLVPAYPEIFLLIMVCVALLAEILVGNKLRYISYILAQIALFGCALITFFTASTEVVYTFSGMFVDDALADALKLIIYITVSIFLVYSHKYIAMRGMFSGEFFSLVLFATLGMMVMISASSFLTLYLGLELLSLSLYAMVALQRDSVVATESAMKFFILGALASGFLLYGMSLVYGATGGALNITHVAEIIQSGVDNQKVLIVGLVFIIAGISFKLSVAPFHMWVPDVYHGAPTAVVLFIGSAPKLAAFGFIMRLLVDGMGGLVADWQGMLIIIAILSMVVGNFAAIVQTNIKRMLAYSTISHMGFMLLGIISANSNGYSSAMFYMVVYVIITLGTFGMIMLLSREDYEVEKLEDFKGLNRRSPWYAFITLLFMFSLAGIPPTVGFYAKLSVLQSILGIGYIWLAIVAVLFSLVGAFYYLRIVKLMYFDEPEFTDPIAPNGDVELLIGINAMAVLILGIFPQTLMTLCVYALHY